MSSRIEEEAPPGDPAPEVLEGRIWVDGCWDFFHHGLFFSFGILLKHALLIFVKDMPAPCYKHGN